VKSAIASVSAIARDPAPSVELRRVMNGKARYQISFWAPDHDAGVAAAVAAVRKHFPEGEVRAA
jgi:hypothetical protein